MSDEDVEDVKELKLRAVIGFDGANCRSMVTHPGGKHVIYSSGNKVGIMEWATKKQHFLVGHTNIISCVAVSSSGLYIASGQINHIGFRARVIVWDFKKKEIISQHEQHKVRVEGIVFSSNDKYVFSLGGRDCGSVTAWDFHNCHVVCGTQVSKGAGGNATVIDSMRQRGQCFITGGDSHLSVWVIKLETKSVKQFTVHTMKRRRIILCLDINERDEFCYCGTTTGDLMKVRLHFSNDEDILEPKKTPVVIGYWAKLTKTKLARGEVDLYQQGIRALKVLGEDRILIGAGDGTVEMVEEHIKKKAKAEDNLNMPSVPALRVLKSTKVNSSVTAIQALNDTTFLAGTASCEIYMINLKQFVAELVVTCHTSTIYDICFPHNISEVFATASKNDVRLWSMATMQELLRIKVQNFNCSSLIFAYDGKSILTGWSDGIIRSFTPLTGRLIYAILNAHNKGISAISCTRNGKSLISGGCEGQVRLWDVSPFKQQLVCTLKEHKGPVSAIDINKDDTEAVSASTDGTCILWDLKRKCRRTILFANTLFMCVKYFPTGVQLLTGGSDRKLTYWEVLDGSMARELEGSPSGAINDIDISPDGSIFVSGGNDQIIKVWSYQEGIATHIGVGHAGAVTATRFSGDGKHLITGDASGCVFVWEAPHVDKSEPVPTIKNIEVSKNPEPVTEEEENIRDLPTVRTCVEVAPCECNIAMAEEHPNVCCRMRGGGCGNKTNMIPDTSRTVKSVASVKSEASMKSEASVKSVATVKSVQSMKSVQSVKSNQSGSSVKSRKPKPK